jgi:hypothetical protein
VTAAFSSDTEGVPTQVVPDGLRHEDAEVVDGVVVVGQSRARILGPLSRRSREPVASGSASSSAVVQAAAAAAGGFVAGAAVLGLVQRRQRRSAALAGAQRQGRLLARRGAQSGSGGVGELLQIVGSRSLLVDVHLLAGQPAHEQR